MEKVRLNKVLESLKAEVKFWQTFINELDVNKESEEYLRARDQLRFAESQLIRCKQQMDQPKCEDLH